MASHNKKTVLYFILAVFLIAFDRFFKTLAIQGFFDQPTYLFKDIFSLSFAKNYFIAFSLPLTGTILNTIIILIILGLLFYLISLVKNNQTNQASLLVLIILGALSNILDRLQYGFVIDYLDLKYFTVFNIADSMIVVGVIILLFIFNKKIN